MSTKDELGRHSIKSITVTDKDQFFESAQDFLLDEKFIRWRLFDTEESNEYWRDFLARNPHLRADVQNAISRFDAIKINQHTLPDAEKMEVYQNVLVKIDRYKRNKRRELSRQIGSVAAVFLIGLLMVLHVTRDGKTDAVEVSATDAIVGETLPDEEIYLLSGDEKISIAHKAHIGLTGEGKVLVTDSSDTRKELRLATAEINRLVVPYGKRTNVTLSDGTEVWLNSGTRLDFPTEFVGDTREIHVNGEIFIDVVHNPDIPFIVHAQGMGIHVQGTSFNVSAYNDDHKKTVVLVNGKVHVETEGKERAELLPNEKIEMMGNEITKEPVDVSEYISWTKGILQFDEAPVSEILKKIGRYYNVQFDGNPGIELNEISCSGKLFLSNNLDSVMTSMSVISSTVYKRENNTIHITKK